MGSCARGGRAASPGTRVTQACAFLRSADNIRSVTGVAVLSRQLERTVHGSKRIFPASPLLLCACPVPVKSHPRADAP